MQARADANRTRSQWQCDSRYAFPPGQGRFKLAGQAEQHRLLKLAADDLDADRQTALRPRQRQGHGWLAGHVHPERERNVLVQLVPKLRPAVELMLGGIGFLLSRYWIYRR